MKAVKAGLSIPNVGRGVKQLTYALKAEEAQVWWAAEGAALLPALSRLLAAFPPAGDALGTGFEGLRFTRTLTLRRVLDAQGTELGLQLTGTLEAGGQARRLTLLLGQSDRFTWTSSARRCAAGTPLAPARRSLRGGTVREPGG